MARIAVNVHYALINLRTGRIVPGAPSAMQRLVDRGHYVSAFLHPSFVRAPLPPPTVIDNVKVNLTQAGIPVHEVQITHRPTADVVIDPMGLPHRGNWGHTLAQALMLAAASRSESADEVYDEQEVPPLDVDLSDDGGDTGE